MYFRKTTRVFAVQLLYNSVHLMYFGGFSMKYKNVRKNTTRRYTFVVFFKIFLSVENIWFGTTNRQKKSKATPNCFLFCILKDLRWDAFMVGLFVLSDFYLFFSIIASLHFWWIPNQMFWSVSVCVFMRIFATEIGHMIGKTNCLII